MGNKEVQNENRPKNCHNQQKTWFNVFEEFADETTLHGVKEITKYWTVLPLRIFFILLQIGVWMIMIYHMYLVITRYLELPVLTQYVTISDTFYKYPSLTFCPQLWLNVTKYHEIGIPKPAFLYALSLMKRIVIHEKVDVESARIQLHDFMTHKNISTYYELYKTLGNDFTNKSLFCDKCSTWPPKKIITEEGVCYQFRFIDWTPVYLSNNPPKIAYNPVKYPNSSIYESFHRIDLSEYMAVGMHENDFLALDPIFGRVNKSYNFRVTPTKRITIDDSYTPCVQNPGKETALMCKAFCRQEIRDRNCKNLPTVLGYFRGSETVGPHWNGTPLFSSISKRANDYYNDVLECNKRLKRQLDNCESKICPPWCNEMTFSTSVQTLSTRRLLEDLPESDLAVIVSYQVRAGVVEVLEVYSYTWYRFLSDVGGLIGLWCGASVVSTIPIATFFLHNCALLSHQQWVRKKLENRRQSLVHAWEHVGELRARVGSVLHHRPSIFGHHTVTEHTE